MVHVAGPSWEHTCNCWLVGCCSAGSLAQWSRSRGDRDNNLGSSFSLSSVPFLCLHKQKAHYIDPWELLVTKRWRVFNELSCASSLKRLLILIMKLVPIRLRGVIFTRRLIWLLPPGRPTGSRVYAFQGDATWDSPRHWRFFDCWLNDDRLFSPSCIFINEVTQSAGHRSGLWAPIFSGWTGSYGAFLLWLASEAG